MKDEGRLKQYPLSIILSLLIWVVCLIPIPETPLNEISFIDKWTHFLMYAILTMVILWERHKASNELKFLPITLTIPILQGILIELAQAYLTTCRSGDWFDALCNTIGVLIGAIIFYLTNSKTKELTN